MWLKIEKSQKAPHETEYKFFKVLYFLYNWFSVDPGLAPRLYSYY